MSCLVWNCRELGNLHTEKEPGAIVQAKDLCHVYSRNMGK